ncbi:N-carbamoyl-L-amino-acid hydrolase [Bradyrhizobium sp. AZCC 1588]|uniref:allantoate amidohydrolase n=1 Tax=unclassified Bradyrhizobium TaxID=2631580 RepID=UPI002FF0B3D1
MTVRIDGERLWSDLMTMAAIGATANGGSYRTSLSDADRDGRNLFVHWAKEAGLAVTVDKIGNIFARREGQDLSLPPVMVGSHLDTQAPGGRFDGVLGVLAGLEVVRTLNRAGIRTRRAIEVVNWTNEEGARFPPGVVGSNLFAGRTTLETLLQTRDRAGILMGDELKRIGYAGDVEVGQRLVDSYIELHIEQGPVLEAANIMIGVVTHTSCQGGGIIEILGENGHSQTTRMSKRRNALVGAARIVEEIERIGMAQEPHGMASATVIDILPNNRINIPHKAVVQFLTVHAEPEGRDRILDMIDQAVTKLGQDAQLAVSFSRNPQRHKFEFPVELVELAERVSGDLGYSSMRLPTWTAHDALNMHVVCPTSLIFVPCRDGISHSEFEWCEPEHTKAGADVLANVALERAQRPND